MPIDIVALLWTGNSWVGRLILLLLLGLGGTAGRLAWRHCRRYQREKRTLDDVRARLHRMREAEAPPEGEKAPPPGPVELAALSEGVDPRTIIGDRLETIARMKQARVKVNVEALQQMTMLREGASPGLAFPGYAVDLAMMLGMLGTFVGLCVMLMQMQDVLPGASGTPAAGGFYEAAQSLGGIIASKKTAFVTTLVGLLCAIVLSGFNFALARAQSSFYDALERFTSAELLPATMPAVEDETAMEKLSLQLSDTFATLGSVADLQKENSDRVQEMQSAFGAIVESIRAITQQAARGPAEEAAGALTTLVKQLGDANEALVRVAESVAASAARERQHALSARRDASVGAWVDEGVALVRRNPFPSLLGAGVVAALLVLLF